MRKAVFLDRDGVICVNRQDYVRSWGRFVWLPGALEAIARLHQSGVPVFIVTNQSGIGRGTFNVAALTEIHDRMLSEIRAAGGDIKQVYYCPHRPEDGCRCRKPLPGMLTRAASEHNVDLASSYMVGDNWSDIATGKNAGTKTILVTTLMPFHEYCNTANGARWRPDHVVDGLPQAVDVILGPDPRT